MVESYASNFDGWGALATAPLFLVPVASSLVIAGYGLVQCLRELRAGSVRPLSFAATSLAALPLLWLMVRRHVF